MHTDNDGLPTILTDINDDDNYRFNGETMTIDFKVYGEAVGKQRPRLGKADIFIHQERQ